MLSEMVIIDIANWMKLKREQVGLAPMDVSTMLGYKTSEVIENFESGNQNIPMQMLSRFSVLYRIPPTEFIHFMITVQSSNKEGPPNF